MLKYFLLMLVAVVVAKEVGDPCGGQLATCCPFHPDNCRCFCGVSGGLRKCVGRNGLAAGIDCETGVPPAPKAHSALLNELDADYDYEYEMDDDEMLYEAAWENLERAKEEFLMAQRLLRGNGVRRGRRDGY